MAVKVSQLPALSAVASDDYLATLDTSASALKKATVSNIVAAGPGATTAVSGLMSASDKIKLDGVAQGAEVNQNAFSNVKVGSTTIQADSKTDTLTLTQGDNVTLTPDASSDSVTISSTDANVMQENTVGNYDFRVLFSNTANDTTNTGKARKSANLKYNPSTGNLQTTQLNGVTVGDSPEFSDMKVLYGTCGTSDDNPAKLVVLQGTTLTDAEYTSLPVGTFLCVKFTNTNTASNCTLSIVDDDTVPTKYTTPASFYYSASVYTGSGSNVCGYADRYNQYMWDGTYWVWCGRGIDADTTYTAMSQSELVTGTATTLRTVRADYLKAGIEDIITQDAWATKNTTAITATSESHANLNDYKTPGNYSSASGTISQYIDNAPTTSAGFNLIVMRVANGDSRIRQIVFVNASTYIYTRYYASNTWSSWVNIAKDTTYSAGTGLSLSGTTINHTNSITAGSAGSTVASSGSTISIPSVDYDAQGHITASGSHVHTVSGFLPTAGGTMAGRIESSKPNTFTLTGTGSAGSTAVASGSTYYYPAQWKFNTEVSPKDGDVIYAQMPTAGHNSGVYVSIDNGTSYQPIAISGTTRLTTQYAEGQYLQLQYESSSKCAAYAKAGSTSTSDVTGIWRVVNFRDSNTTYSAMSASEMITGTATTSRTIRADYFRTAERQLAFMIDKMEAITATSSAHVDLNTYTNAGNFSANNSNSAYVDNQPRTPGTGFNLVVVKGISSSNYARQLLWYYDSDDLFVRSKSGSTASYTDWHLIAESSKPVYRPNLAITSTSSNWVQIQIPKLNQTYASTYPFTIKFTVITLETTNYTPQSAEVTLSAVLDMGWTSPKALVKYSNYNINPDSKGSFIGPLTIRAADSTNSIYVKPSTSSRYSVVVDEIICTGESANVNIPDYYGAKISTVPGAGVPSSYLTVPIDIVPHMNRANGVSVIAHTSFDNPVASSFDCIYEAFYMEEKTINGGGSSYVEFDYCADSGEPSVPLVLGCEVWCYNGAGENFPATVTNVTRSSGPKIKVSFTTPLGTAVVSVSIKYTKVYD